MWAAERAGKMVVVLVAKWVVLKDIVKVVRSADDSVEL